MNELLSGFSAVDWSASTLLALGFVLIFFGRLLPRYVLLLVQKQADDYKAAYETERAARLEMSKQLDILTETTRTVEALVRSIQLAAGKVDR